MNNNKEKMRFELDVHGKIVFADYRQEKDTLIIDYVEAPLELRGSGAAGMLMQEIVAFAQQEKLKIIAHCSYARSWLARHTNLPR